MDSWRDLTVFNFNNFNGWECSSGYSCILSLFHLQQDPRRLPQTPSLLEILETGSSIAGWAQSVQQVLVYSMLIVKCKRKAGTKNALGLEIKPLIKVYDESWYPCLSLKSIVTHSLQKQWNGLSVVREFKDFIDRALKKPYVWDIGCGSQHLQGIPSPLGY